MTMMMIITKRSLPQTLKKVFSYSIRNCVNKLLELTVDDLEFSLKNDPTLLLEKSQVDTLTSLQINIIKMIVCSGLYPNISIPDEANHTKRASEQFYHTKNKRFLSMHPTSVFSTSPEGFLPKISKLIKASIWVILFIADGGEAPIVRFKNVPCFLGCLETNKTYLMNIIKIPGLYCLLFGKNSIFIIEFGINENN